jgi:hypothetical protein
LQGNLKKEGNKKYKDPIALTHNGFSSLIGRKVALWAGVMAGGWRGHGFPGIREKMEPGGNQCFASLNPLVTFDKITAPAKEIGC